VTYFICLFIFIHIVQKGTQKSRENKTIKQTNKKLMEQKHVIRVYS